VQHLTTKAVDQDPGNSASSRGVVRFIAGHDLRARWTTIVLTGLLIGLVAGLGIACLSGARRTDTLFARQAAASNASQLDLDPGSPSVESDRAIRAMPEVVGAAYWAVIGAFVLDDAGLVDEDFVGALTVTTDGRYLDIDRVAVRHGRLLDPSRPDEVMINDAYADRAGLAVGSTIGLGLVPTDEDGFPIQAVPTQRVSATVVGIMVTPDDVVGADLDQLPRMFVSPAFGHLLDDPDPAYVGYSWYGLRLRNGDADVDRVLARWQSLADEHNAALDPADESADPWLTYNHRASELRLTADRSVRPVVVSFAAFGALVLLASIVLLAQAFARMIRSGGQEMQLGRTLGLSSTQAARVALAAPGATAAVAGVVAAVVAVVGSARFPFGRYRVLEPDPGIEIDATMLIGLAAVLLVPLAVAGVVAFNQSRQRLVGESRAAARASRTVSALTVLGAPLLLLSAVRLTFENGRGRSFVPTRLVLLTAITTVVVVSTTLVFGHNLGALANEPARFGWKADALVLPDAGYGDADPATWGPWLDARSDVEGWRVVGADRTTVAGRETPGLVFGPSGGDGSRLTPVVVTGRAPARSGEIVLGRRTLDEIGLGVGDAVTLGVEPHGLEATIVGVAVFPDIGPTFSVRARLDDGLWIDASDRSVFTSLASSGSGYNALLLDVTTGSREAVTTALDASGLAGQTGVDSFDVIRPVEVVSATTAANAQDPLIAAIAAAAIVSLLLTLVTVVRRRRHELSILGALGFTPGQLRATVLLQGLLFGAIGLIVGTPIGTTLGRLLWRRFADSLGVVPDPSVPWAQLGLSAVAVLAVGVLSALGPAVTIARSTGRLDLE
jgi:hypothetical protein